MIYSGFEMHLMKSGQGLEANMSALFHGDFFKVIQSLVQLVWSADDFIFVLVAVISIGHGMVKHLGFHTLKALQLHARNRYEQRLLQQYLEIRLCQRSKVLCGRFIDVQPQNCNHNKYYCSYFVLCSFCVNELFSQTSSLAKIN